MSLALSYLVALVAPFVAGTRRGGKQPWVWAIAGALLGVHGVTVLSATLFKLLSPATGIVATLAGLAPGILVAGLVVGALRFDWRRWRMLALAGFLATFLSYFVLESPVGGILAGVGFLALGAWVPWLAPAMKGEPRAGLRRAAVACMLFWIGLHVAFSGLSLFWFGTEGRYAPQEAEQEFHLLVRPEGPGAWSVDVPFPRTDDAEAEAVLAKLRDEVEVTRGDARLEWIGEDRLRVSGQGEAEVAGALRFRGHDAHLESLQRYVVPQEPALAAADGQTPVRLSWWTDLKAGNDAHCWSQERATLRLAPGESAPLPRERAEAPVGAGHVPLFCSGFPPRASEGATLIGHGKPLWPP